MFQQKFNFGQEAQPPQNRLKGNVKRKLLKHYL